MDPSTATRYLTKAYREIKSLNRKVGRRNIAALFSYFDFLWCYARYGCLINQYVNGNFWRYRHPERRHIMTYRRVSEFITALNSPDYICRLNDKVLFNKHFHEFVKRKWLSSENMTFKDFRQLCETSHELIVKPLDECEGKGIELITPPSVF